jgi:hypothetical protein
MSLRELTVNENLFREPTQNCSMANVQGSCLGAKLLSSWTHPSAVAILGVGLLCKSDDPLHHLCLGSNMPNPLCDICRKPVKLETSKTNELGKAVHERCYLLRVMSKKATSPRQA